MKADYSLYLVTDSTEAILGNRDIVSVVSAAVEGGVTIVQYREKNIDTAELVRVAKELHAVTKKHGVPLLINDRVDVCLAVGCEGVHIGQDDMDLKTARQLLGKDKIIGVTASNVDEATSAAKGGADYLGIGTVYATPTKEDAKSIIGPAGVRNILTSLASEDLPTSTVCIGGINASNIQRIIFQSQSLHSSRSLSGVAVVSAIMAAPDPKSTSSHLLHLVQTPPPFLPSTSPSPSIAHPRTTSSLLQSIPSTLTRLAATKPLCHNITNLVVQNLAANVALAAGGSPIMSDNAAEMPDLAALQGSLVINMGTVTPVSLANYTAGLAAYNAAGGPVLLDPVGGGATAPRRAAVAQLLRNGYFSVLKGNESEVLTLLGESADVVQHGVDSARGAGLPPADKARVVKRLAARERCVALMTGAHDYLSDGAVVLRIANGTPLLGEITGSGCALGTVVAAFAAALKDDALLAALAGCVMYEVAAENAAARPDVKGPGTFVPALIDELYALRKKAEESKADELLERAKVEVVEVD